MTREEAIERVRTRFDKWALDNEDLTALHVLGLVDVESEDERMLREIKRYIKEQGDKPTGLPNGTVAVSDMIAWLEKQKGIIQDKVEQRMEYLWDKLPDAHRVEEGNCTPEEWKALGAYMELEMNFDKGSEEEQKGQKPEEKPINWTELTWKDINELEGIINNVHYEFRNGIGQESFGKEVLERFREYKGDEYLDEIEEKPKKQEWSEEDRNNFNRIAAILVEGSNVQNWWRTERLITKEEMQKLTDWLKSLPERFNLQPKQEWSEKDSEMITNIISSLHGYIRTFRPDPENKKIYESIRLDEEIDWLKSLRPQPHWKPSEEQMKWLRDVIETVPMTCRQQIPLESLYNDLKKL